MSYLSRHWMQIRRVTMRMIFASLMFVIPGHAHAAEPLSVEMLARLPVQQDGRIKPLEQYARVTLRQLSGRESLPEVAALPWLGFSWRSPPWNVQSPHW